MLTDDEARTLLHRAADTIEVGPGHPLPMVPQRRRWPVVAAATAAVALIATVGVVISRDDRAVPQPADLPGQVPSVFAYDAQGAVAMLEELGLDVITVKVPGCETAGRAIGTRPRAGTTYDRGDKVELLVAAKSDAYCDGPEGRELAWELIDLATGRGPGPLFAPRVDLWVNGSKTHSFSAEQASVPANWAPGSTLTGLSALSEIAADSVQTQEVGRRLYTPGLTTRTEHGSQFACAGYYLPPSLSSRTSLVFWIDLPIRHMERDCSFVNLFLDEAGRVDTVVLRTASPSDITEEELAVSLTQRAVATEFVAWARNESAPAPAFANRVELLLNDDPWVELSAEDASSRGSMSYCSGLPPEECGVNPLRIFDDYDGPIVQSRTLATMCAPTPRRLPESLAAAVGDELVRLDQPEAENCDEAFAAELWITPAGEIRAVNLILPSV